MERMVKCSWCEEEVKSWSLDEKDQCVECTRWSARSTARGDAKWMRKDWAAEYGWSRAKYEDEDADEKLWIRVGGEFLKRDPSGSKLRFKAGDKSLKPCLSIRAMFKRTGSGRENHTEIRKFIGQVLKEQGR